MALEREWVSIRDPDDDHLRYDFDVSFLLSAYRCIYGDGCPGINGDPVIGCCEHGAYWVDEDERERFEHGWDEILDADLMQFHDLASERGITEVDEDGEGYTRIHDGACIFLNRAGWPAGEGCAFHVAAMQLGEHHMTHKPTVCWQVPLHRDIREETANDGGTLQVHRIAAFERGTWGTGGAEFDWWCMDDAQAFVAEDPVYRRMEPELRAMVGDAVYRELRDYLDGRDRIRDRVAFLPVLT